MKITLILGLLSCLLALSSTDATECELPPKVCLHLESVSNALQLAVERSINAIGNAVDKSSSKISQIRKLSLKRIGSEVDKKLPSDIDKLKELLFKFEAKLEDIRAEQSKIAENANQEIGNTVRKITSLLQKTTAAARSKDTKASKIVTEDFKAMHKTLNEALKAAHKELKEIVLDSVKRFNGLVKNTEVHMYQMLQELGIKKDFNTEVLENAIKENAAEEAEKKAEGAFDVAVAKTEAFIDEIEMNNRVSKRSLKAFWDKVKVAMRKVGRIITEAAAKVWEKMKPILMEKLKDVGKVVLETAKMIIIKVGEELISYLISGQTGTGSA